jgi:hypothetical protein
MLQMTTDCITSKVVIALTRIDHGEMYYHHSQRKRHETQKWLSCREVLAYEIGYKQELPAGETVRASPDCITNS